MYIIQSNFKFSNNGSAGLRLNGGYFVARLFFQIRQGSGFIVYRFEITPQIKVHSSLIISAWQPVYVYKVKSVIVVRGFLNLHKLNFAEVQYKALAGF